MPVLSRLAIAIAASLLAGCGLFGRAAPPAMPAPAPDAEARGRAASAAALDPLGLGHASYALELVRELAPPEAPDPGLLDHVVELWRALAAGPSPALLRGFELALCAELGSAVVLDACAACGAHQLGVGAVFDPARGGAVCGACAARSTGLGVRPLDEDVRAYLRAVAAVPLAAAPQIAVEADVRLGARDAMLGVITHLVGHPLTTLEFVTQVHGGLAGR